MTYAPVDTEKEISFLQEVVEFVDYVLANERKEIIESYTGPNSINWGDLSCTETKLILNNDGDSYVEVIIEEASPDNSDDLIKYVLGRLGDQYGGTEFRVYTEW